MPNYTIDTGQLDHTEAAMVQALALLAGAESEDSREQARQDLGHALLGAGHWEDALWADMQDFYQELLASNDNYPYVSSDAQDRWRDSPYCREWDWATDRLREWTQNPDTARAATTQAHKAGKWTPPQDGYPEEPDDLPDMRHTILDMALVIADPSVHQLRSDDDDAEPVEPFDMWTRADFGTSFVVDGFTYDSTVWSPDGEGSVMLLTDRIDRQLRERFLPAIAIESQLNGERFSSAFRLPNANLDDVVVEVKCYVHFGWTAALHRDPLAKDPGPWFGPDIRDNLDCLLENWAHSSTTDTADALVTLLAAGDEIEIDNHDYARDDSNQSERPRWDTPIQVPPDVVAPMRRFEQRLQTLRQAARDARTPQRLEDNRTALEAELQHRAEQRHTQPPSERRLTDLIVDRGNALLKELQNQIAGKSAQRWYTPSADAGMD